MDREELIKLKLQMGLSPLVAIDPQVLRAMWRGLCLERMHARRARGGDVPRVTTRLNHPYALRLG